jgi:surfactin synthase thioesterase subunit
MPGREARLREPPITRWEEVIWRLSEALMPWMDRPFALFGHSLGALVAFEFARHLDRDRRAELIQMFVSGREAPQLPLDETPKHNLPHEELLDELRQLAGTNEEVLKERELLDIFIPLLRADFFLSESHVYEAGPPLNVPITAYGGMQDEHVLTSKLEAWCEQTTAGFRRVMFPGGHFFLHDHRAQILTDLAGELGIALPSLSRVSSYR